MHGATVEPLPGQPAAAASGDDDAQADEWMRRYNTRWVPRHRYAPDASADSR